MGYELSAACISTWRRLKGENQLPKVIQNLTVVLYLIISFYKQATLFHTIKVLHQTKMVFSITA